MDLNAARVEGSTYLLSLKKLLDGREIDDIHGCIDYEFGEPVFHVSFLVLKDGTQFFFEGEHDLPYLIDGSAKMPVFPEEDPDE